MDTPLPLQGVSTAVPYRWPMDRPLLLLVYGMPRSSVSNESIWSLAPFLLRKGRTVGHKDFFFSGIAFVVIEDEIFPEEFVKRQGQRIPALTITLEGTSANCTHTVMRKYKHKASII